MFSSWLEQLNICHNSDRFPISAFDSSTCDSQPCFISVCRVPLPVPGSLSSRRTVHARQCFLKAADTINDWTSLSVFCTGLSAQELYHKWLTEEQWHFAWRGSDYLPGFEVPTWTCMQAFICVCTVSAPAWIISIFRDITNIFSLLFFLHLKSALFGSTVKRVQSLPFLTLMHTIMFQSPNKGKNAGHLQHVDPIIELMHPIFGYICSNVLFHLSSPHFHHSHSPRALCLNFWVWWTHVTQPMCSQNSGMISSYCVPALHDRALMYPFMSISLLIVKTCKSSEFN